MNEIKFIEIYPTEEQVEYLKSINDGSLQEYYNPGSFGNPGDYTYYLESKFYDNLDKKFKKELDILDEKRWEKYLENNRDYFKEQRDSLREKECTFPQNKIGQYLVHNLGFEAHSVTNQKNGNLCWEYNYSLVFVQQRDSSEEVCISLVSTSDLKHALMLIRDCLTTLISLETSFTRKMKLEDELKLVKKEIKKIRTH